VSTRASIPEYHTYFNTYFEEPEVSLFSYDIETASFFSVPEPVAAETYYYYDEPS
jgi:hypothetical protein